MAQAVGLSWKEQVRLHNEWGWVNDPPMTLMEQRLLLFNRIGIIAWKCVNNPDFSEWEATHLRAAMAEKGFEFRSIGVEGGVQVLFVNRLNGESQFIPHEANPLTILLAQYKAANSAVTAHHRLIDEGLV